MLQVDSIQSYLNLKIDRPLVLKAGSSGKLVLKSIKILRFYYTIKQAGAQILL